MGPIGYDMKHINIKLKDKKDFQNNGHFSISNFFQSETLELLTNYYWYKLHTKNLHNNNSEFNHFGEGTSPYHRWIYGDLFNDLLLNYIKPVFNKITDKTLAPTYTMLRFYETGDSLKTHLDRPSCQYSATICIGSNIPVSDFWHLYIDETPISTPINKIIFYRGTELQHYRKKLPFDGWVMQLLLHFVDIHDKNFNEHIYDKREKPYFGMPRK